MACESLVQRECHARSGDHGGQGVTRGRHGERGGSCELRDCSSPPLRMVLHDRAVTWPQRLSPPDGRAMEHDMLGALARSDDNATEILPLAEPSPAGEAVDAGAPSVSATVVGRSLGKFAIVELLGRGGSGEVYRAEQPQLGRSAVIKTLRRDVAAAPNRVDRFLREAKLA